MLDLDLSGSKDIRGSLEEARKEGIIKLNKKNKEKVKDGIVFYVFDKSNDEAGVFAVCNLAKDDCKMVADCEVLSNYLYPPLKRNFISVVRITSYVLLAVTM